MCNRINDEELPATSWKGTVAYWDLAMTRQLSQIHAHLEFGNSCNRTNKRAKALRYEGESTVDQPSRQTCSAARVAAQWNVQQG